MLERPLDLISFADFEAFVTYGRTEGDTFDFKEKFPSADHKGVGDFLTDVTAFANTDGDDIIVASAKTKMVWPDRW